MAHFLTDRAKALLKKLDAKDAELQAKKDARDAYFNQPKTSYRLRYTGPEPALPNGNRVHLVPLPGKNLHVHMTPAQIQKDICPTCQTIHSVKTVHLWIEPNNTCLVSAGVKESIEKDYPGGLTAADLVVDGGTHSPPPLKVGKGKSRREVDQENERITHWGVRSV